MINKLQSLFPNSIITNGTPNDYFGHYHWLSNETDIWMGIPKEDLLDNQLVLLKSLFDYYHSGGSAITISPIAQKWYSFLLENGPLPTKENDEYRLIYFQWKNGKIRSVDFESALKAFFDSEIIIVWETDCKGMLVEAKSKQSQTENDFLAMFETIRADFYIEPAIYVGKFRNMSDTFLSLIHHEQFLFDFAIHTFKQDKLFHFEKVVPHHLASHLPDSLKIIIQQDILPIFYDDQELFSTIKAFLQNNMNASITSKNLFIHRNTLQYRLDKFTDKTGIHLKNFHSAMTVYLACILFE